MKEYPKSLYQNIKPLLIFKILIGIVLILSVTSIITSAFVLQTSDKLARVLYNYFYLDYESNVPAWFSSVLLAWSATILFLIFFLEKKTKNKKYWLLLAFFFLVMSMDESVSLHEKFIDPIKTIIKVPDWLHFAWVIPGFAGIVLVALFFIRFLKDLPGKIRTQFILAAIIYFGGAIGFELLGGFVVVNKGKNTFSYNLVMHIEEILEMVGVSYFIYILLSLITRFNLPEGSQVHDKL